MTFLSFFADYHSTKHANIAISVFWTLWATTKMIDLITILIVVDKFNTHLQEVRKNLLNLSYLEEDEYEE